MLEAEIEKASEAGITVVGAAGNDGDNVKNYMPGSVEVASIIGACDEDGNRIKSSNYGSTVDYNVVASSTSEAAAKFSGYISKNGISNIALNKGVVYATNYNDEDYQSKKVWFRTSIPKLGGIINMRYDYQNGA